MKDILKRLQGAGTLFAVAFFIACLIKSESVAEYSRKYLFMCGERVVPALFVFSVLGNVIASGGVFTRLCRHLPRYGTEAGLIILGLCAGFPLGAIVAAELYENGAVTKRQAEYLCAFANTPSLSFIISYTGNVLGGEGIGTQLALLTLLSAVVTAVLLRPLMLKGEERKIAPRAISVKSKGFAKTLKDGCESMVIICGCVVFFGGISAVLPQRIGALLELSTGISRCKNATEAAALLGFSGVSVIFQIATACKGKLNITPCVAAKVFQCAFMGLCSYFFIDG